MHFYFNPIRCMKNRLTFFLIVAIFCFPHILLAQEKPDITGVWTGQIYNDSTKKLLPFELAISQKNGELSGYSYTIFMIDSVENIGVKAVNIHEERGLIIIKDRKLIDDNYSDRPAKGVRTTLELNYTDNDTTEELTGKWFTNKTKQFYPLSGTASLSRRKYYKETRIFQKLRHLGLANNLSFFNPHEVDYADNKNEVRKSDHVVEKGRNDEEMITIVEPEFVVELPRKDSSAKIDLPKVGEVARILEALDSTESHSPTAIKNLAQNEIKKDIADRSNAQKDSTVAVEEKTKVNDNTNRGAQLSKAVQNENLHAKKDMSMRKIETIQAVKIFSDSIVLSLYDNGTIDGDTVSVILNNQVIVSRVGLLAKAYNYTVHLTPEMGDSIKIVMYAENLGSIPPNTGLLVIRDGGTDHEIRFSGDLQKNSAIILLRNKKQ